MGKVLLILSIIAGPACAQSTLSGEEKWGVVLEHPDMNYVVVTRDLEYARRQQGGSLQLDIYTPPVVDSVRGCVIFLTEVNKDKSWQVYQSWPRLAAAYGLIGIAVNVDKEEYLASVRQLLAFITSQGREFQIDTSRVGVFIPTHVPHDVINFLVKERQRPQVKAAVMFNSNPSLQGPFRGDLPVYYVTDDQLTYSDDRFSPLWDEVQKNKAPWTLKFGAGMPIFFESFAANDEARKIVRESIYFFKNHLEPLPESSVKDANDRDMIAALYRADYEKAATSFKDWLDKYPDDQYALLKYAMISFIRKNYVEAEHAYRKIKDLHPVYRIDLVKTLLANNKEAEASRELTLAIRSGKVKRTPYPGIATFLYSLGRYSQGIAYYEMASEKDLKGEDFYNLARGYIRINDVDKTLSSLQKAIKINFQLRQTVEDDPDFVLLRRDARYRDLINGAN